MGRSAALILALGFVVPLTGTAGQATAPVEDAQAAAQANQRGAEFRERGEWRAALAEFEAVVKLVPSSPYGWYNLGLTRRDLGDCRRAVEEFSRALALRPDMFNALYQRGNCRQALGQYDHAIDDYTRALTVQGPIPARFLAYLARGDAARRLGRLREALADYSHVLELRTDTKARRSRAWTLYYLGRWAESAADATRYLHDTEGKETDALYTLLLADLALRRAGHARDADALLERWGPTLARAAWPGPVLRLFQGQTDETSMLGAADTLGQRTEARAYLGMRALARGDRSSGVDALQWVLREGDPRYWEYGAAYYELRRLGLAGDADRRMPR